MATQSALEKEQMQPCQIGIYDLQNKLESLKSENEDLRRWLERLEELIREANPVLWVYQAPSFKRALDAAQKWESDAQEILRALERELY